MADRKDGDPPDQEGREKLYEKEEPFDIREWVPTNRERWSKIIDSVVSTLIASAITAATVILFF